MINHINLTNFKAFQAASIDLSNLNLFTGVNGMGKSSFLQALLLLRQSQLDRQLPEQIVLNHDKYVKLGKSQDVLNIYASEDEDTLNIHLTTTSVPSIYVEIKPLQNKTALQVNDNYLPKIWQEVKNESLFNDNFQYLYAEREAPKETAQLDQYAVEVLRSLGRQGQHTAHFIAKYQAESVKLPSLIDPNAVMMCALAAQDGVQLIIETHSDHVLNGIRVAAKHYHEADEKSKLGKGIDCEKIKIFFFERQTPQHNTQIVPIRVNKKGRLSKWPKAFFDEWSNMLDELMD